MKNFKKVLRLVVMTLFLVFAAFGAGMGGVFMPKFYRDDSILPKIELVEEREEEDFEKEEDEKT
ncbi:MAG: hypothetical protein CMB80_24905 [Flammeovirgaceae bacterium]|nr:hypothetical protein [Flammeovirgaceae bacterium]MBR08724.1 hypothetical protein [Rickettsiales bacterium]HCX23305.1 hypothetical protein [Cytophagales bacterium]|tara:strand:+ start:307 stop:498 length:192 start_codon:yes stop_codon:yes gene_type:complete